jgi:hypothetical protein
MDWQKLSLFFLFFLLPTTVFGAVPAQRTQSELKASLVPPRFGKVIFRKNSHSPMQVFIVVDSHRSCVTGGNGPLTVQAQIDTFRIGEWLIRQKHVDLLLPEGFFGRRKGPGTVLQSSNRYCRADLRKELTDTHTFVNAELLLSKLYGIGLHQVENGPLYRYARHVLRISLERRPKRAGSLNGLLEYLQRRRLAAILQSIPGAIKTELHQGTITSPKAMVTIGMSHLDDLVDFLEKGRIHIPPEQAGKEAFHAYNAPLRLAKEDIGVTVIVPRALLQKREMMEVATLEPSLDSPQR